jgi:hypothetical protein
LGYGGKECLSLARPRLCATLSLEWAWYYAAIMGVEASDWSCRDHGVVVRGGNEDENELYVEH